MDEYFHFHIGFPTRTNLIPQSTRPNFHVKRGGKCPYDSNADTFRLLEYVISTQTLIHDSSVFILGGNPKSLLLVLPRRYIRKSTHVLGSIFRSISAFRIVQVRPYNNKFFLAHFFPNPIHRMSVLSNGTKKKLHKAVSYISQIYYLYLAYK